MGFSGTVHWFFGRTVLVKLPWALVARLISSCYDLQLVPWLCSRPLRLVEVWLLPPGPNGGLSFVTPRFDPASAQM